MKRIDLRSDTVTTPTPAMRAAMASAEVGDDVYGEDPTVNRLEATAAARFGKEAGLFVPSGTMGNQTALLALTGRGDEVILEETSHIVNYEVAGMAVMGALMPRTLRGHYGILNPEQVRAAIRPPNIHTPRTACIAVESTHNRGGGTYYSLDVLAEIGRIGREHGIAVHLDGARIFNASVASGVPVKDLAAHADTVQFCFSKGLAAPVGSMLVGSRAVIDRARKYRKMVGGGMRQAGILAAAALLALEAMVDRLAEDHANARLLGEGLAEIPGIEIDLKRVQTNIVIFAVRSPAADATAFTRGLAARGILAHQISPDSIRLVTHKDVNRDDILTALAAAREILAP
jgi:threonine aldolase